ncbi:MAG: hypothetical protein CL510_10150 [Actinobacteria bacterium]|nr:hypothetical protein [Actinomycetota bacterium]
MRAHKYGFRRAIIGGFFQKVGNFFKRVGKAIGKAIKAVVKFFKELVKKIGKALAWFAKNILGNRIFAAIGAGIVAIASLGTASGLSAGWVAASAGIQAASEGIRAIDKAIEAGKEIAATVKNIESGAQEMAQTFTDILGEESGAPKNKEELKKSLEESGGQSSIDKILLDYELANQTLSKADLAWQTPFFSNGEIDLETAKKKWGKDYKRRIAGREEWEKIISQKSSELCIAEQAKALSMIAATAPDLAEKPVSDLYEEAKKEDSRIDPQPVAMCILMAGLEPFAESDQLTSAIFPEIANLMQGETFEKAQIGLLVTAAAREMGKSTSEIFAFVEKSFSNIPAGPEASIDYIASANTETKKAITAAIEEKRPPSSLAKAGAKVYKTTASALSKVGPMAIYQAPPGTEAAAIKAADPFEEKTQKEKAELASYWVQAGFDVQAMLKATGASFGDIQGFLDYGVKWFAETNEWRQAMRNKQTADFLGAEKPSDSREEQKKQLAIYFQRESKSRSAKDPQRKAGFLLGEITRLIAIGYFPELIFREIYGSGYLMPMAYFFDSKEAGKEKVWILIVSSSNRKAVAEKYGLEESAKQWAEQYQKQVSQIASIEKSATAAAIDIRFANRPLTDSIEAIEMNQAGDRAIQESAAEIALEMQAKAIEEQTGQKVAVRMGVIVSPDGTATLGNFINEGSGATLLVYGSKISDPAKWGKA